LCSAVGATMVRAILVVAFYLHCAKTGTEIPTDMEKVLNDIEDRDEDSEKQFAKSFRCGKRKVEDHSAMHAVVEEADDCGRGG